MPTLPPRLPLPHLPAFWAGWKALAVFALLLAPLWARAATWRGVTPGVTTRGDVVSKFGDPSQTARVKGREVLTYLAKGAPKGTTQVQFRISDATQKVDRIDVFPKNVIDRAVLESTYGGACGKEADPAVSICFQSLLTPDGRVYLLYSALRVVAFLRSDGRTVFSLVYGSGPANEAGPGPEQGRTTASADAHGPEPTPPLTVAQPASEPTEAESERGASSFEVSASTPVDSLKIGGTLYLRAALGLGDSSAQGDVKGSVDAPMLMDVYLDGRPNDRIRGFLVGRLIYDPVANPNGTLSPLGVLEPAPPNPQILLDQFWLKFDIAHQVFLTLGRQHVKWGVSKLWSPVDFLSTVKLDPLALFDLRVGTDMVRVHVPLSSLRSNFYGVAFVDTLGAPDKRLRVGGAVRAETLLFGAELALSAAVQDQRKPRFGFDFSTPLGSLPVDLYGEVALFRSTDHPVWEMVGSPDPSAGYAGKFQTVSPALPIVQASAGVKWQIPVNENASAELGLEAFYNSTGYTDPQLLPWLLLTDSYDGLYAARGYAALYAAFTHSHIGDGLTLSLFGVANLADQSMATRLNASLRVLTDLNLEATVGVPLGRRGGEFNFAATVPSFVGPGGQTVPSVEIFPQRGFFQVGIRIDI